MARHSKVETLSGQTAPDAQAPRAGQVPESLMPAAAAGTDLLAIVMRAHVLRGDPAAALHTAQRLSSMLPARPDPVDIVIDAALERGRIGVARAVLQSVLQQAGQTLSAPHAALLKARIARADGDLPAARAILVLAIEQAPLHAGLRVLLTEMMVAAGTASDARAVLTHIGQAPVNPRAATPSDRAAEPDEDAGPARGATLRAPDKRIG